VIQRLLVVAESLIPTISTRVGAGRVEGAEKYIKRVLIARPDLSATFESDVCACTDELIEEVLAGNEVISAEFERVALIVVGSYYMNPEIRSSISYPGQLPLTFDPMEYVSWIGDGLLDQVVSRGNRYREVEA
jgi:hypothetical protein